MISQYTTSFVYRPNNLNSTKYYGSCNFDNDELKPELIIALTALRFLWDLLFGISGCCYVNMVWFIVISEIKCLFLEMMLQLHYTLLRAVYNNYLFISCCLEGHFRKYLHVCQVFGNPLIYNNSPPDCLDLHYKNIR